MAKPPGQANGRPLTVALALSGDLTATLDPDSTALTLTQQDGQATLRHAGLMAYDASGRELRAWLELRGKRLLLHVDDSGARYPLVIDPFVQQAKLTASDGAAGDAFGISLAISGDTVLVGAARATFPQSLGAAYVFSGAQAPAITSANNTTFQVGTAGSFTVTTTGSPTPSITESGALPSGVTFHDNGDGTGTLSGTPAAGTSGTYNITFTAHNGVGSDATQNFTLTVQQAPAITSANNTTFQVGTAGSFTVTTTGSPTPSITESGTLPSGVTFHDNGNGTGTLSGTPAAGTGGTYNITFTASNGVGSNATQTFTLRVQDFSISATPSSQTVPAGHMAVYTLTLSTTTGFTGAISMTCSGGPPKSTCTISPSSVTLTSPSSTAQATIDLNVPKGTSKGTFTLTFTGTSGTLTHSTTATLTVK